MLGSPRLYVGPFWLSRLPFPSAAPLARPSTLLDYTERYGRSRPPDPVDSPASEEFATVLPKASGSNAEIADQNSRSRF